MGDAVREYGGESGKDGREATELLRLSGIGEYIYGVEGHDMASKVHGRSSPRQVLSEFTIVGDGGIGPILERSEFVFLRHTSGGGDVGWIADVSSSSSMQLMFIPKP